MGNAPTASHSLTVRLEIQNQPGMLGKATSAIGNAGGDIGAIDVVEVRKKTIVRDLTFKASDEPHGQQVVERLKAIAGVEVALVSDRTSLMHLGGKIDIKGKIPVKTRDDLSMAYTPGVARVCMAIHHDPDKAYTLTTKQNTVAVVSDGTAVLGLGDIGPNGAAPVMEGKALIFKEFAGVDAWPICLATKDVDEIVTIVKALSPVFGGINLEDISAPRCFEIEERLQKALDIPVFHDDQHGTAVVVLAALINALKVVKKRLGDVRVMATGRSDYPNQINNSCCFPGFFRGMLDVRAKRVNDQMKLAAAHALASIVAKGELSDEYITPSMFDARVVPTVAAAVAEAAVKSGVARKQHR